MEYTNANAQNNYIKPAVRIMKTGDLVILYERHDSQSYLYLEEGKSYNNKFGNFLHNDFIGHQYGSKIHSRSGKGWIYALEASPTLWSGAVKTRTQIVNELDSSFVIHNLDLYPGCQVVESGTGSGAMTVSIAKSVYPTGHIYTYEYNATRADQARMEFEQLGLKDLVTVTCQDVCAKFDKSEDSLKGFKNVDYHSVHAVFLDLPEPWHAIEHALNVLIPGRHLCCYSPCIEQVIRTCEEIRKKGFHSIRMFEVRHRPFDARSISFDTLDMGRDDNANSAKIAVASSADTNSSNHVDEKNMTNTNDIDNNNNNNHHLKSNQKIDVKDKKRKLDKILPNTHSNNITRNTYVKKCLPPTVFQVARPINSMQGHTAFLTFAVAPCNSYTPLNSSSSATIMANSNNKSI